MSYKLPRRHKCDACNLQIDWTPDDVYDAGVIISTINNEEVFCPNCLEKFIRKNVPVMRKI